MNSAKLNQEFGYKNPQMKHIKTTKDPFKTKPMPLKTFERLYNSFRMTGVYVPNENMLDGYKKLVMNKYS